MASQTPSEGPPPGDPPGLAAPSGAGRSDWGAIVAVFWITSMVEGLGVSQVFAFIPAYLRQMGVADAERASFVGIFSALIFVVGMPFVPLWGVWADKISRKAIIVRSALVEAVVFVAVGLSREPWQLGLSLLLIGLQLGNTGVMLAGIRDVVPKRRIGTVIAIFGASGPIGFAVGPSLGGLLIDGLGWSISAMFLLSSGLSVATAVLVWFGSREVRPEVVPTGSTLALAYGAVRGVLADRAVRRIFLIYGVAFLANQTSRPFQPIIVEGLVGHGPGLAASIGFVAGTAALVGAIASPLGGVAGDRFGFRPILIGALIGGAVALFAVPIVPAIPLLALAVLVFTACNSTVGAMVSSLLAPEVPAERRSLPLNLVYLPLYAAGVIGPAVGGAIAVVAGPGGPFWIGSLVFLVGGLVVARRFAPRVRSGRTPA
jgi:MFS family permease